MEILLGVESIKMKRKLHPKKIFNCDYCKNKSTMFFAWYKKSKKHFCCKKCANNYQLNTVNKKCKICNNLFSVRKCEIKKFVTCNKKECRIKNKTGKNNPNYRHGLAYTNSLRFRGKKYKDFIKKVYTRDDYTCKECGIKNTELNVHHLKPYRYFPKLRYNMNNCITLCLKCHYKTYKDVFKFRKNENKK